MEKLGYFPLSSCLIKPNFLLEVFFVIMKKTSKGGIYMRLGRIQTSMNLYRCEIFAVVYMEMG